MKIGIAIICRFNSSRLPGKILRKIGGVTILDQIYTTLLEVVDPSRIIVTTSFETTDDPISQHCKKHGYLLFRGDLENVALRFLNCGVAFGMDYLVRINGDNFFIDINLLKEMVEETKNGNYDFLSNVKGRTFPKGMSFEIVRVEYFKECYRNFTNSEHFQHVTPYFYENENENYKYFFNRDRDLSGAKGIQLAIDTISDLKYANKIFEIWNSGDYKSFSLRTIYNIIKDIK